jgi:branched-chain amino acid transport system ATP-binding protein
MPLLELRKVSKSFGALLVNNQIDLTLEQGTALGILGPNGAGKTTLLNLIAGDLPVSAGQILFDGVDITRVPAAQRCHLGIGRTAQIPRPFTGMTVFENVLVGATHGRRQSERASYTLCRAVLIQTGLFEQRNVLAGHLRLLDRKRLELARALAIQPRLLLFDEIAGGLTEHEVHELLAIIQVLRGQGVTIIWIEHIVHVLVAAVDRILAMNFGNKLTEGSPQAVIASPEFKEIYFGVEGIVEEGRETGRQGKGETGR